MESDFFSQVKLKPGVCLTFMVNKFTGRFLKQHVLLAGLLLYSIGYVTITSANSWYFLLLFNFIGTIGELVYLPVRNAEMPNMIPEDKRGSYFAFSNVSFSGADLLAKSTIIIGAFLISTMLSVYMDILLMIGTLLVYAGLFVRKHKEEQATEPEIVQNNYKKKSEENGDDCQKSNSSGCH